jgi:hypothetical protein
VRSRHGPRHCNRNESGNRPLLRKGSGKAPRVGVPASSRKAGSQETCLPTIEQRSSGVRGAVTSLNRILGALTAQSIPGFAFTEISLDDHRLTMPRRWRALSANGPTGARCGML